MLAAATTSTLNSVDYFILFTFGLSMIAGYVRGFTKEIISLISWVAAAVISTLFADKLAHMFSGSISGATQGAMGSFLGGNGAAVDSSVSMVSLGVSFVLLFLGTLFVGYLVGTLVTGIVQGTGESLANRFLGMVFGGVRGFIIVIILMFVAELTPLGSQPAWVQSQFVQSFHPIVAWVDKMVHPGLEKIQGAAESAIQGVGGKLQDVTGSLSGVLNGGQ